MIHAILVSANSSQFWTIQTLVTRNPWIQRTMYKEITAPGTELDSKSQKSMCSNGPGIYTGNKIKQPFCAYVYNFKDRSSRRKHLHSQMQSLTWSWTLTWSTFSTIDIFFPKFVFS